jgi:hypothetical protein
MPKCLDYQILPSLLLYDVSLLPIISHKKKCAFLMYRVTDCDIAW